MHIEQFFEHWRITENPFRAEEARQDPVFQRLHAGDLQHTDAGSVESTAAERHAAAISGGHSDFEKIVGRIDQPSTSIVFGEKGSGKTAIRLQIERLITQHNATHPQTKCLLIPYDDLNPVLDRFIERQGLTAATVNADKLRSLRLVDHMDALLSRAVPGIVDSLLLQHGDAEPMDLGDQPRRAIRKADTTTKHDLLLLQAIYDRPERAPQRTRQLRWTMRLKMPRTELLWRTIVTIGWLPAAAVLVWGLFFAPESTRGGPLVLYTALALAVAYLLALAYRLGWQRLRFLRLGRRVHRQIRTSPRDTASYASSLRLLDASLTDAAHVPMTDSDDQRYAMLDRLRRVARIFGYTGVMVIMDRVDEPTIVSGDPERMQAIIWPMFNNKFLQQAGIGFKMLLPMELRHALFRESALFFQEARMDKQNLVERLAWTGAMLYDLCNARIRACRPPGEERISLVDLFDADVSVRELIDALDQMSQPRDAFKLIYQCLTEHCSNVPQDEPQWRIPKLVLETVRKNQAERVRQLYRGVRPA